MVQHHQYRIDELENLMPYERDIFYNMLLDHLAEVEKKQAAQRG